MSDEYYKSNLFGEVVEIGLKEEEEEEDLAVKEDRRFNIFALTDAVSARDKRQAWIIYREALASGLVADEIFWRVAWGVKTLLLASKTASPEESGLNPFVFNKAKNSLKNWKKDEVEKLSKHLVMGYHECRRGKGEMETMIEKFLLRL